MPRKLTYHSSFFTNCSMERSSAGNNVEGSSSGNTIGAEISHDATSGGRGTICLFSIYIAEF